MKKLTQPYNLDNNPREERPLAENINNKPESKRGKKWYSVIKSTTPFVQSYMIATVKESRAVASASAENLK
jgi:hypothetical protein